MVRVPRHRRMTERPGQRPRNSDLRASGYGPAARARARGRRELTCARRGARNAYGAAYLDMVSVYAALGVGRVAGGGPRGHGGYFGSWSNFEVDQK